jgi:hypothetical protein
VPNHYQSLYGNEELAVVEGRIYRAIEHLKIGIQHAYAREDHSIEEYKNRMVELALASEQVPLLVRRFVAGVLYDVDQKRAHMKRERSQTYAPHIQCPACLALWIQTDARDLRLGAEIECSACQAVLALVEHDDDGAWSFEERVD